jgi:methionyl-tRNA synthetase
MKSFYITTPIYYVNSIAHIGHAYTTISCDILARFHKLKKEKVYFTTGTDEHGQKIERSAKKASVDTKKFVDNISKTFRDLVPYVGCEIDDFIRTTDKRHHKAVQNIWNVLKENNQIYLSTYEGWYSVRDEAYFQEDELTKKNENFFAPSGASVEWIKEESYFFKLSQWQDKLLKHYEINKDAILPKTRYNEVISFIKSGLKDLSISRTTFKWGIPVPNDDNHIIYVWLDALMSYKSAIGYPDKNHNLKDLWPAIHVVGKDILRFHAVFWPAFLMAANLPPPKKIFAHGWWTNEGKKISKSENNSIDPYDIISTYGLDQIRYFLFREVPFGKDGDFSKGAIAQRVNADLSNNYGNLIQRICSFIKKNCSNTIENIFDLSEDDKIILDSSVKVIKNYNLFMESYEIDKALKEIFKLITEINVYVDKQAPWTLKKDNIIRMNIVLSVSIELIKRSTLLLYPIIPGSCLKVFKILNLDFKNFNLDNIIILPEKKYYINQVSPIFPRIEVND